MDIGIYMDSTNTDSRFALIPILILVLVLVHYHLKVFAFVELFEKLLEKELAGLSFL